MDFSFPTDGSGNLKIYDVVDAFNNLKKTNSAVNMAEEDSGKVMMSYLSLRSNDGGRFEEKGVVGLVVVNVGGVVDDLLEAGVILTDVDRCSRNVVATLATCQHQNHLCRQIKTNNQTKTIRNIVHLKWRRMGTLEINQ